MGIFATRARAAAPSTPETRAEPPEELAFTPDLVAVGEALVAGADPDVACSLAGRRLASAGVSLDEALAELDDCFRLVRGSEPDFAAARALARGWSEATLDYLHRLTCADPVTGLASLAHLQSRLPELYRGGLRGRPCPRDSHALVVLDVAPATHRAGPAVLAEDLAVARVAEAAATVFPAGEATARLAARRVVVLAERDAGLGRRVALLKQLAGERSGLRAWIEGLPETDDAAAALVAELARA